MDLGLAGKKALVTGSTKGIGRGIAETLLAEGASVAICARNADEVAAAELDAGVEGAVVAAVLQRAGRLAGGLEIRQIRRQIVVARGGGARGAATGDADQGERGEHRAERDGHGASGAWTESTSARPSVHAAPRALTATGPSGSPP